MNEEAGPSRNPTLRCIASSRRREILDALLRWGSPQTEERLAAYLAAVDRGTRSPGDGAITTARTELFHDHLPALETAGLVAWNRDEGTVETTSHPALEDPRFERLLELRADGLDEVLSGLSHEHRRIVLTVLVDERTPTSRTDLAREVARRRRGTTDPEAVEAVAVSLHHVQLPKLDDLGLVEYDPETSRVAYPGHTVLEGVFAIVHEPDASAVDGLSALFEGLHESYREARREPDDRLEWPSFWGEPHRG